LTCPRFTAYQADDYLGAVKWYRKAVEQGDAKAQYNLGVMYYSGEGVLQDTVAALMWFNIAAVEGHVHAAENTVIVAKKLSSADIVKAQKMAKRCMSSGYKDCD
jgi:TPR repeat protein